LKSFNRGSLLNKCCSFLYTHARARMARRYINIRRWNTWYSDQPAILREVFTHKSKGIARRKSDRAQNDEHAYVARCDSFGGDNPIRQLLKSFKK